MTDLRQEFIKACKRNFGEDNYRLFSESTVGVAGLGGLGSCVSVSLARASIGRLVIVDFDYVEYSNLNRQQYFLSQVGMPKIEALSETLQKINPCLQIEKHLLKLTPDNIPEIFADCDVVCECFDLPDQKQMLVETVLTQMPRTPITAASGMASFGGSNDISTKRVNPRFYLTGDGTAAVGAGIGLYAARVGIAANHQANTVLEILAETRQKS